MREIQEGLGTLTLRLTPRGFFSPSSMRSNLPMLAVLARVIASERSNSPFRSDSVCTLEALVVVVAAAAGPC